MTPRSLLFGGEGGASAAADAGLLAVRLFAGLSMLAAHGLRKLPPSDGFVAGVGEMGFPAPLLFAWGAALAETLGAVLIAAGLLTRPAAVALAATMAVAAFLRHAPDPYGDKELPLLYLAVFVGLALTGAGRFSVDRRLAGRPDA